MKIKYITLFLAVTTLMCSCEKLIEIEDPTDSLSAEATYSSREGIKSAATGLYTGTVHSNVYYYQVPFIYYSMFSDDMNYYRANNAEYFENTYTETTSYINTMWTQLYKNVYQVNDFIAHISNSSLLTDAERRQYMGEALWFRAYDYFWLVSSWGDVPLVLSNKYEETSMLPRSSTETVWQQIISDLKTSAEYLAGTSSPKTRITSSAAIALLARAYLYTGQWQQAIDAANLLIPASDGGSGTSFKLETITRVFLSSSNEAILHFNMEGFIGSSTYVGYTREAVFAIPTGKTVQYKLSPELVASLQSDMSDQRNTWMGSVGTTYYPYKYKQNTTPSSSDLYEYQIILRLAEQYLIRAEANAHLGNTEAAVSDVNVIRNRAGVADLASSLTQEEILLAIEEERRKEYFCEQGHRWFDLRRTGRIDAVLSQVSWKKWQSHKALLPIPQQELNTNKNLTQNEGYAY